MDIQPASAAAPVGLHSRSGYDLALMSQRAYIALGSNLGNRAETIIAAVDRLNALDGIRIVRVSSLLENPAVGGPADSPAFLNAAAEVETSLDVLQLLGELLAVEQTLGRHRVEKWGPRVIDLDLLLFGSQTLETPGLVLPHPLMHCRLFVLQPLAEIAPKAVHPVLKKTIRQLLADLAVAHPPK